MENFAELEPSNDGGRSLHEAGQRSSRIHPGRLTLGISIYEFGTNGLLPQLR